MELLPDWVAILYFLVAGSGIDSTLWHAAIIAKKEPFMPLAGAYTRPLFGSTYTHCGIRRVPDFPPVY